MKKLFASVRLMWESEDVKAMGVGCDGLYAEVDVEYTAEQLETMLLNEDSVFDIDEFMATEDPDEIDDDMHVVLTMAIEDKGNLPANTPILSKMGLPDAIQYRYSNWGDVEEDEDE